MPISRSKPIIDFLTKGTAGLRKHILRAYRYQKILTWVISHRLSTGGIGDGENGTQPQGVTLWNVGETSPKITQLELVIIDVDQILENLVAVWDKAIDAGDTADSINTDYVTQTKVHERLLMNTWPRAYAPNENVES